MDNNLFIDAMPCEQRLDIDEIKANKDFALRLINDLDRVFQTNYEIQDEENSVLIRMKRSPSFNWHRCFRFVVDKSGISFRSSNLGYYKGTKFKNLGELYEKYKDSGTTADIGFLRDTEQPHGFVHFVIPINRNGNNKQELRDIIYLMEQEQFLKRF